jgi:dTMP kinase
VKLFKKGLLICFVGIDGAGKTLHALKLVRLLKMQNHDCKYVYGRWKPVLSYPFLAFLRLIGYSKNIVKESRIYLKRYYGRSKPVSLVWLFFIWIDVTISTFFRVLLPLKRGKIVICDRYVYDVVVDAMADLEDDSLIGKIPFRLILVTTPKPEIVFLMDADESIAFARKKDTPSVDYLRIRRKLYFELATRFSFLVLDSTKPLRTNTKDVVTHLHKFFQCLKVRSEPLI